MHIQINTNMAAGTQNQCVVKAKCVDLKRAAQMHKSKNKKEDGMFCVEALSTSVTKFVWHYRRLSAVILSRFFLKKQRMHIWRKKNLC